MKQQLGFGLLLGVFVMACGRAELHDHQAIRQAVQAVKARSELVYDYRWVSKGPYDAGASEQRGRVWLRMAEEGEVQFKVLRQDGTGFGWDGDSLTVFDTNAKVWDRYSMPKEKVRSGFRGKIVPDWLVQPDSAALPWLHEGVSLIRRDDDTSLDLRMRHGKKAHADSGVRLVMLSKHDYMPLVIMQQWHYDMEQGLDELHLTYQPRLEVDVEFVPSSGWKRYVASDPQPASPHDLVGQPAPSFDLKALQSSYRYDLDSFSGQPLLIDFWYMACPPCIKALPMLARLWQGYEHRVGFLGINHVDNTPAKREVLTRWAQRRGVEHPILLGGKQVIQQYHVTAYPTFVLIDANGMVHKVWEGFSDQIEFQIREALYDLAGDLQTPRWDP